MNRRVFLQSSVAAYFTLNAAISKGSDRRSVAITIDDPNVTEQPLFDWKERGNRILNTLRKHNLKAALFVCGKRIDSDDGKTLIKMWNDSGHMICNHSYSHLFYNAPKMPFEFYRDDFLKGDGLVNSYPNFQKFYRYPYLKEGDTAEKRDAMRSELHSLGYRNGYVTIDASDWAIDDRLKTKLKNDPTADTKPYRDYLLKHILDRANYYDTLSNEVLGRSVTHTILLHHTLLNALYLDDLIAEFKRQNWNLIGADEAYKDSVFLREPKTVPAGESLIWALAKETGRYDDKLRYPGEDDSYEKDAMDAAKL